MDKIRNTKVYAIEPATILGVTIGTFAFNAGDPDEVGGGSQTWFGFVPNDLGVKLIPAQITDCIVELCKHPSKSVAREDWSLSVNHETGALTFSVDCEAIIEGEDEEGNKVNFELPTKLEYEDYHIQWAKLFQGNQFIGLGM